MAGELVDYVAVGSLKSRLLRRMFRARSRDPEAENGFERFRRENGDALRSFALFEAISAHQAGAGGHAGWHGWPCDLQNRHGEAVARFDVEHQDDVRFQEWLQFIADGQLGNVQARAKAAGMRIGLYLDFAVGVAPDGADTWADPELTVSDARVGAPPDMFNSEGQDWGLAPLSPQVLAKRHYVPLADAYQAMMKNAGAIRIDHAMGLARLWWIPTSGKAGGGGYVRYPLGAMIDAVAKASGENGAIVVGEDLGTVPEGFRRAMNKAGILSYRVLYFEQKKEGVFVAPSAYPKLALACISTHDLATLAGWWAGSDVKLRAETGRQDERASARDLKHRDRDRRALLQALDGEGLLASDLATALSGDGDLPDRLSETLAVAVHRYGARSASILFAVQVEDMVLSEKQPNLPGTTDEYPNWRVRSQLSLDEIGSDERFQMMARAMREERPDI